MKVSHKHVIAVKLIMGISTLFHRLMPNSVIMKISLFIDNRGSAETI